MGGCSCFLVNTIMDFCYNWFSPQKRPLYLSIISIMNIFGGGLGNLIPIMFVNNNSSDIQEISL